LATTTDFDVITFDCYGTLIDWETGIRAGFKQALWNLGLSPSEEALVFDLYEKEEKKIESGSYVPYRSVLAEALSATGRSMGKTIPEESARILAEQLPKWLPFPDTNPSLQRLASRYRLGILSNVDNDLLSGTLQNFPVSFDILVTAEKIRSYKPKPKHWLEAKTIIGERGWLHVAGSLFHDIEPATKLGIRTVWINRKRQPTRLPDYNLVREMANLTQLADWLDPSSPTGVQTLSD
jgi:2-haloalkanoic acid dehalogenase type II